MADLLDLFARPILRRVRHRMATVAVGLHLEDVRPLAGAAPGNRLVAGRFHRAHIHAVDLLAGDVEGNAALGEIGLRGGPRHRRAHGISVVLDDVDDRQLPQFGHVEALIDLTLVGGAVAEIGDAHGIIAAVAVGKGQTGAERHLRTDNAVAAIKVFRLAEHVHGAALALGVAPAASCQLGHHAFGLHARREHVTVVAVSRYDLVALLERHLHPDDHGFLADIEVAEPADRAHAIKLPGLLLEAPDQQHLAQRCEFLFPGEFQRRATSLFLGFAFFGCSGHGKFRLLERVICPL